jgi:hypothetical protein
MTRRDKDLRRILDGRNDSNIDFAMLVTVLRRLGYEVRTKGSHRIVTKVGVPGRMVLQPRGTLSKDYQVRQVRHVILEHEVLEPDE